MRSLAIDVLRVLDEDAPLGLDQLARACGAPRARIERCVAGLEGSGLARIEAGAVRLAARFDFLDCAAISAQAGARGAGLDIEVVDCCGSTNAELLGRAAAAQRPALLVAEEQTAGRGRRGRRWRSPAGAGLTLSLLRRMRCPPARLAGLSLACGVAVLRALRGAGVEGVGLKWPNDLLCDAPRPGAKLGGILVESRVGGAAADVVVGIGINCRSSPGLESRLRRPVAALQDLRDPPPSRNALAAAVARELLAALDEFDTSGLAPFRGEWERHHAQAGRELRVRLDDGRLLAGIAGGIAEDGGLLLHARSGTHAVRSGSILSARPA